MHDASTELHRAACLPHPAVIIILVAIQVHVLIACTDATRRLCLQSAEIAQQLETTQENLDAASAQLCMLQQQLQDERKQHEQSLAVATAEAASAQQQLVDEHEQQLLVLRRQQQEELCQVQLAEQRLDGELAEAKLQLAAALQELDHERLSSGQLHEEMTRLHHEFEDARKRGMV